MLKYDKMADELMKIYNAPKKYGISEPQEKALYYAIEALLEKYYDAEMQHKKKKASSA